VTILIWSKIKSFIAPNTVSKTTSKSKEIDFAQLVILTQILRMHRAGKVIFFDCTLEDQEERLLKKGITIGFTADNLVDLEQEIKRYLSDNALGKL
jgi:hypothetical protein